MNEQSPDTTSIKDKKASDTEQLLRQDILTSIHEMLADLDNWARQQNEELAEADNIYKKIFESKLPDVLYHATTHAKAKRIMLEGLKPHKLEFEDEEVVSLSDSITYAKFCASVTQATPEHDLVVLEVTTLGLQREQAKSFLLLPNKVKPEEPLHEVHYLKEISADWIHQLSEEETHEILTSEYT